MNQSKNCYLPRGPHIVSFLGLGRAESAQLHSLILMSWRQDFWQAYWNQIPVHPRSLMQCVMWNSQLYIFVRHQDDEVVLYSYHSNPYLVLTLWSTLWEEIDPLQIAKCPSLCMGDKRKTKFVEDMDRVYQVHYDVLHTHFEYLP